jgi:threonine dehydratase
MTARLEVDLSPARIEAAVGQIDPVFLDTPQFVDDHLSSELGRKLLVKVETLNPIGSFKGRGTSVLARELDPQRIWVCSTAGNFGQGLAYAARERGTTVHVFVSPAVPAAKVARMRRLGALVEVRDRAEAAAREHAAAGEDRLLVVDALGPAMAEGAGTIAVELAVAGGLDVAVVQLGDGALISGIACWLKTVAPRTRVVGVCASGAPAMARSFAAGRAIAVEGTGTIATALAITEPIPESVARVTALVDDVVLVDDDDLRGAMQLIADSLGVLVEPAGAAGIAALARHGAGIAGERVAVILTGSTQAATP